MYVSSLPRVQILAVRGAAASIGALFLASALQSKYLRAADELVGTCSVISRDRAEIAPRDCSPLRPRL